mmetsp:Transcript_19395/g.40908  ORF Transcript_19395/g.40908 Transcript_19395/m.40908 type:complete len:84 (-) Transcript_19395:14-265(-)
MRLIERFTWDALAAWSACLGLGFSHGDYLSVKVGSCWQAEAGGNRKRTRAEGKNRDDGRRRADNELEESLKLHLKVMRTPYEE